MKFFTTGFFKFEINPPIGGLIFSGADLFRFRWLLHTANANLSAFAQSAFRTYQERCAELDVLCSQLSPDSRPVVFGAVLAHGTPLTVKRAAQLLELGEQLRASDPLQPWASELGWQFLEALGWSGNSKNIRKYLLPTGSSSLTSVAHAEAVEVDRMELGNFGEFDFWNLATLVSWRNCPLRLSFADKNCDMNLKGQELK